MSRSPYCKDSIIGYTRNKILKENGARRGEKHKSGRQTEVREFLLDCIFFRFPTVFFLQLLIGTRSSRIRIRLSFRSTCMLYKLSYTHLISIPQDKGLTFLQGSDLSFPRPSYVWLILD